MIALAARGIFNRNLYHLRQMRARGRAPGGDYFFLHNKVFQELWERKQCFSKNITSLALLGHVAPYVNFDFQESNIVKIHHHLPNYSELVPGSVIADDEALPFGANTFDCIISSMQMHSMNDLPGFLRQVQYALVKDGLFLAAFVGGESLLSIRCCLEEAELEISGGITPRFAPMVASKDVGVLLQRAGFHLSVVDVERINILYKSPDAIFSDIRMSGEASMLYATTTPLTKNIYNKTCELLGAKYRNASGLIEVNLEILYMMGIKSEKQKTLQVT